MQKSVYYFKPILLTEDGRIFVDYSNKDRDNKITFNRFPVEKYIDTDENFQKSINKIIYFFKKNGLVTIPSTVAMHWWAYGLSETIKEIEQYFFLSVKKGIESRHNDDLILMELEDFLADENINFMDKEMITTFFNGQTLYK